MEKEKNEGWERRCILKERKRGIIKGYRKGGGKNKLQIEEEEERWKENTGKKIEQKRNDRIECWKEGKGKERKSKVCEWWKDRNVTKMKKEKKEILNTECMGKMKENIYGKEKVISWDYSRRKRTQKRQRKKE